ncbi:unnamed protein product [Pieris macdunnoughi]|uniref:Uncharacterized protein n=1 Tax=Pieris macdunnoughi TaxID=345717 RepID=A0A821V5J6_9NEOP|nr:unnamed protein product [Pieris macdunnoughi]
MHGRHRRLRVYPGSHDRDSTTRERDESITIPNRSFLSENLHVLRLVFMNVVRRENALVVRDFGSTVKVQYGNMRKSHYDF